MYFRFFFLYKCILLLEEIFIVKVFYFLIFFEPNIKPSYDT